jgi:hypothetical protein
MSELKTYYRVCSFGRVEEVKVTKETDCFVYRLSNYSNKIIKEAKSTSYYEIFANKLDAENYSENLKKAASDKALEESKKRCANEMYKFLDDLANGRGVDYPIEQLLAKARGEK